MADPVKLTKHQKSTLGKTNKNLAKKQGQLDKLNASVKEFGKVAKAAANTDVKAQKQLEKAKASYKGRGDVKGKEKLQAAKANSSMAKKAAKSAYSQYNKLANKRDRKADTVRGLGQRQQKYASGGGRAHNG